MLQACLRHPDSSEASQNRDTVFCQMRRAMDLIHYVVKDGVKEGGGESMALTPYISEQDGGDTLGHALNVLDSFVDMTRYIYIYIYIKCDLIINIIIIQQWALT